MWDSHQTEPGVRSMFLAVGYTFNKWKWYTRVPGPQHSQLVTVSILFAYFMIRIYVYDKVVIYKKPVLIIVIIITVQFNFSSTNRDFYVPTQNTWD
jgi:hypothetical protein